MIRCSVFILGLISVILSIWGILVYEFDICAISGCKCIYGWPETAKNLSYGVISGWIIFGITVGLPYIFDWQNSQESISEVLKSLNEELSNFIISANLEDDRIEFIKLDKPSGRSIISANSYAYILYQIPWDKQFPSTNHSYTEQAFVIIKKISTTIADILQRNKGYLTGNQLECFNLINSYILRKNWDILYKEENYDQTDFVKDILSQIILPLQKCLGISLTNFTKRRIEKTNINI